MAARLRLEVVAVIGAVMLTGCASAVAVPWDTYDPAIRTEIADAVATHSCGTLQGLLTAVRSTSAVHQQSTGFSNDNLAAFIENAQRRAGCP